MVLDISKQMSGWNTQSTRWSRLTKEQEDYILNASRERNETETWAMVDADKLAKKYLEQQKAEQRRNEWLQTGSNLFLLWMNAEDPDVKKTYMTGDRTQSLKNYFVNWYHDLLGKVTAMKVWSRHNLSRGVCLDFLCCISCCILCVKRCCLL